MKVLSIAVVCGYCGRVLEVEEIPEKVDGLDVIGVVRHTCYGQREDSPYPDPEPE